MASTDQTQMTHLSPSQEAAPEEHPDPSSPARAGSAPAAGTPATAGSTPAADTPVREWFFTLMCISIPIAGWIYLICLAFSKNPTERRNFARALLFYKLLFLMISIILIGIVAYISLDMIDQLLAHMEML